MISKAKANVVVISQWEHPELGELIHALRVANIEISAIVFAGVISAESADSTYSRIIEDPPLKKFLDIRLDETPVFSVLFFFHPAASAQCQGC